MAASGPDRRVLTEFSVSRRVVIEWTAIGTGITLLALFAFSGLYAAGTGQSDVGFQFGEIESVVVEFGIVIGLIVGVIVIHEAIHAIVLRYFGGDVSFGVGLSQYVLPYAFVTSTERLSRNQFITVALAPFVLISAVGVPVMIAVESPVLIIPLAVNAGGAIGDLWMTGILLRYSSDVFVEDSITGLTIYGTDTETQQSPPSSRTFVRKLVLGSAGGLGVVFVAAFGSIILMDVLEIQTVAFGVPHSTWSAFTFERGPDGFSASVNMIGVVTASMLLGLGYSLVTTARP